MDVMSGKVCVTYIVIKAQKQLESIRASKHLLIIYIEALGISTYVTLHRWLHLVSNYCPAAVIFTRGMGELTLE